MEVASLHPIDEELRGFEAQVLCQHQPHPRHQGHDYTPGPFAWPSHPCHMPHNKALRIKVVEEEFLSVFLRSKIWPPRKCLPTPQFLLRLRGGKVRAGDITLTLQCWARDVSKMRSYSPFRHYVKFTPNNTFQWYFRGTVNPRDSDSRHSLGTHNARNPSSWYFRGLYPFSPRWRSKASQAPPTSYFWRGVSSDWVLVPRCAISCTEWWQSHCGSCCSWDRCLFH